MSYLGPFNKEFRELLITRDFYGGCVKLNIPVTKDMQVTKFLVDDSEVGEWTLQVYNSWVTSCTILLIAPFQGLTVSQASNVLLIAVSCVIVVHCCEQMHLYVQRNLPDCLAPHLGLVRAASYPLFVSRPTYVNACLCRS